MSQGLCCAHVWQSPLLDLQGPSHFGDLFCSSLTSHDWLLEHLVNINTGPDSHGSPQTVRPWKSPSSSCVCFLPAWLPTANHSALSTLGMWLHCQQSLGFCLLWKNTKFKESSWAGATPPMASHKVPHLPRVWSAQPHPTSSVSSSSLHPFF